MAAHFPFLTAGPPLDLFPRERYWTVHETLSKKGPFHREGSNVTGTRFAFTSSFLVPRQHKEIKEEPCGTKNLLTGRRLITRQRNYLMSLPCVPLPVPSVNSGTQELNHGSCFLSLPGCSLPDKEARRKECWKAHDWRLKTASDSRVHGQPSTSLANRLSFLAARY